MTLSQVSSALCARHLLQHSPFKGQVVFFMQLHNIGGTVGVGFSWSNSGLWDEIMEDMEGMQMQLNFTLFLLKSLCKGLC